jgi:hypothetical protein
VGNPHDQQGEHQHGLAAKAVTVMTEDGAPDGAGDESNEEGGVGQERADERIELRKEQRVEHDGRHDAVKKEIVPFNRGADGAGQCDFRGRDACVAALRCRLHVSERRRF